MFQGATPRESQDQHLIRPQKALGIPTDLLSTLKKDIDSRHDEETLPPRKIDHSKDLHPTWSPKAPTTHNPTTMAHVASETKPSLTSLVITTVDMEAEPDTLLPGRQTFRAGYNKDISKCICSSVVVWYGP